jgi:hypothetical protein
VAATLETNAAGEIYPAIYLRGSGLEPENTLDPDVLLDFRREKHAKDLATLLVPLLGAAVK